MTTQFFGDRLRLLRQFWGLSGFELGQTVGVSRQFIHLLEIGQKTPSPIMLSSLADALSVTTAFFSMPLENGIKIEQGHFRKLQTTPLSLTQEALAYATLFEELVTRLETYVHLPRVNLPHLSASSTDEIEIAADQCRTFWGLGTEGPISNVTRALENAGVVVALFDKVSEKIDAFSIGRGRPIIVRNSVKESLFRQRFDLAHECAHLTIHVGLQTGDRFTEAQANRFASAFLMPRGPFSREFPRGPRLDWTRIFRMKLRWKVSAAAILRRAFDLGLIDAALYKRGNIHLADQGWRKIEPYDLDYNAEQPELVDKSVNAIFESGLAASSALAGQLGLAPKLLARLIHFAIPPASSGLSANSNVIFMRR